jgi:hypothetical protein
LLNNLSLRTDKQLEHNASPAHGLFRRCGHEALADSA